MKGIRLNGHMPGPWVREGLAIVSVEDKVVGRFQRAIDAEVAAASVEALWVLASLVMGTAGAILRYEEGTGPKVPEQQLAFAGAGALTLAGALGRKESTEVRAFAAGYDKLRVPSFEEEFAMLSAELVGFRRNLILAEASRLKPFLPR